MENYDIKSFHQKSDMSDNAEYLGKHLDSHELDESEENAGPKLRRQAPSKPSQMPSPSMPSPSPSPSPSQMPPPFVIDNSLMNTLLSLFHTFAAIFALYLSFICNKGFDMASFLSAGICPYIYILYVFAVYPDLCGIRK